MSETASATAQKSQGSGIQSVSGTQGTTQAQPLRLNFSAQDFIGMLMAVMTESGIRSLKVTKNKDRAGYRYEASAARGKDIRDAYATRLDFDVDEDGISLVPQAGR